MKKLLLIFIFFLAGCSAYYEEIETYTKIDAKLINKSIIRIGVYNNNYLELKNSLELAILKAAEMCTSKSFTTIQIKKFQSLDKNQNPIMINDLNFEEYYKKETLAKLCIIQKASSDFNSSTCSNIEDTNYEITFQMGKGREDAIVTSEYNYENSFSLLDEKRSCYFIEKNLNDD
tara:strand:- start:157 stop:681 length:525 start_codon:yes stop_codon:yes gene_type:complete